MSAANIENLYKKAKNKNTQEANKYLAELNALYNKKVSEYRANIEEKKKAVPQNYTYDYDLNAINRLINERKLTERIAKLGLNNSGANATLKTGLDIAKNNADNLVTMRKNKELQALETDYNDYYNKLDNELQGERLKVMKELNNKNASLYNSLTNKYSNTSNEGTTSSKLLSVYNKLVDMHSPSQQKFYIDMVLEAGIITPEEANKLKKKLHLYEGEGQ